MEKTNKTERTAMKITRAVGSPASVVIHTILFAASFASVWSGIIHFDRMLLVLTTIVSLEAIYLSIFIQMTINFTTDSIEEVSEDIEEIQEDIDEMQEDVEEIQEDVDELQEDVEDIEESDDADEKRKAEQRQTLVQIHTDLQRLMQDINKLQNRQ